MREWTNFQKHIALPKLIQDETEINLNRMITTSVIKFVI